VTVRVLQGDCRAVLATLPADSVQACITSPPYFGLRSYGTEPQVWGGDPAHSHTWGGELGTRTVQPQRDNSGGLVNNRLDSRGEQSWSAGSASPISLGAFCPCGAWRGELGGEPTPELYVAHLVEVFREVRRVLRPDGVCLINLGDSYVSNGRYDAAYEAGRDRDTPSARNHEKYAQGDLRPAARAIGAKPKDLWGIPWMVAFALRTDGWWLRASITWCKNGPMPESVEDRPTRATEMVFLLAKSPRYFWNQPASRVLANKLNRLDAGQEVGLKERRATAGGLAAERGEVSLNDQWAPYLVLAALLGAERVLVKERDDLLGKVFDVLKTPVGRRVGVLRLVEAGMDTPAQVFAHVLQHIGVVVAQDDLHSEAELRVRLAAGPYSMPGDEVAFPVEQARKVMAEVIANAQLIRDAIPFDALTERPVDVDAIRQAVPLFQGAYPCASERGDGLITEPLLEQLHLALADSSGHQRRPVVAHLPLPLDGVSDIHCTTEVPSEGHNIWDWWVIGSGGGFKQSHFATMPSELAEACVILSTSDRGCCPRCLAPWMATVERESDGRPNGREQPAGAVPPGSSSNRTVNGVVPSYRPPKVNTTGWAPSCRCDAGPPIPQTVLDPFGGAGTTALEADRHGRDAIICELNPAYAEMAERRLVNDAPLFASLERTA
jgi:hypothetical protein